MSEQVSNTSAKVQTKEPVLSPVLTQPNYDLSVTLDQGIKTAVVKLRRSPDPVEWERLNIETSRLLEEEYRAWVYDMKAVETCNSLMLGMLVTLNAVVASRGGFLSIKTRANNVASKLLKLTKLEDIIPVTRE